MSYDYRLDKYYDEAESELSEDVIRQLKTAERYKDLEEIARGGMKTVYKAFDEKSQRYIAYATLKKDASAEAKESFIKEARLTAKLNHPNIIPVYNMGLNDGVPYFTMELKTGDSLKDIIDELNKENPNYTDLYDTRKLLEIFVKICDAIDFAHSKKVIHLDIKPDNIQVGSYGEVIVCDWGLSKIFDRQYKSTDINQELLTPDTLNTETLHGHIKGTPGYMAPEQISGESKTARTDIFSLGCLLYALLYREAPFKGEDLKEILQKTLSGSYRLDARVPESITAVIRKAMEVDPADRYESAGELKKDIENYLQGYATLAEEASSLKLLRLFIARNKALSLISFISLLIIISGTIAFIKSIQEEKEIAEENLRLFKEQKEETYKAQKEYYQELITKENNTFHANFNERPAESHEKTIRGLKQLIEAYPDYSEAKSALGYHLFVGQKFNEAEKLLKKDPGIYSYMLPHIEKYKKLKRDDEFLEPQMFVELLSELEPLKALHLKMLMLYSSAKAPNEIIPAIKHILHRLNPDWNPDNFIYKEDIERLTIIGKNFKRLNLTYSIPSPILALRVKSLTLRATGVENISALKDASIRALDISDTTIPFHNILNNQSKALLRLIINSGQFTRKQLEQLPAVMEIKFSDVKN